MTEAAPGSPARAASTAMVARDGRHGLEVLLLERSQVGAFAGMWVFPGGRVDAGDTGHDELARARAAAVREAHEEAGLVLDPARLVTWAHWQPPPTTPVRFSTWFFVAPWSGEPVVVDDHEIVAYDWVQPAEVLARRLAVAPPTYVTLHQLSAYRSVEQVLAEGPPHGVERFATRHGGGDRRVLLWHGDAGYEATDPDAAGPRHRAIMDGMQIVSYERTVGRLDLDPGPGTTTPGRG